MKKRNNHHDDTIRTMGSLLGTDESSNSELCPYCNGGSKNERSFSITRTVSGIVFNCHRASCGRKGFVPTDPNLNGGVGYSRKDRIRAIRSFEPRRFTGELQELSPESLTYLQDRYRLEEHAILRAGYRTCWNNPRQCWLPVRDHRGFEIGGLRRFLAIPDEKGAVPVPRGPKAIAYQESPGEWAAFYGPSEGPHVFVTEDHFSALRIFQNDHAAVALIGTNMSYPLFRILNSNYHTIILALDPDATKNELEIAQKYSKFGGNFRCCMLSNRDPKDMTPEELRKEVLSYAPGN